MADQPRRRLRRGVAIALAVVVVAAIAVGAVAFVRSRQVERSVEGLCEQLTIAQDLDQALTALDPTTLQPQVDALVGAEAVAPTEIEGAVTTLADFVESLTATVSTAEGDRQEALAEAMASRQAEVDAVTQAGTSVQQWAEVNCGLSLTGVGVPDEPGTPTPESTTTSSP